MEDGKVLLRSYNRAWKYERKIYAIDKLRLIIPIAVEELEYFVVGLLLTLMLLKILPFLNELPFIIRFLLLPYGLMKFLTKKKFDGKPAHKFLIGYVQYLMLPNAFSRFEPYLKYKKGRFTSVAYRGKEIVNIMEQMTKKKERWKKSYDV